VSRPARRHHDRVDDTQPTAGPGDFTHAESIHVDADPRTVWDVVSDVTRTGEWSPVCARCEWDEGDGPWVGAHFTGHNAKPDR
jgi:hypothetical protein